MHAVLQIATAAQLEHHDAPCAAAGGWRHQFRHGPHGSSSRCQCAGGWHCSLWLQGRLCCRNQRAEVSFSTGGSGSFTGYCCSLCCTAACSWVVKLATNSECLASGSQLWQSVACMTCARMSVVPLKYETYVCIVITRVRREILHAFEGWF